MKKLILLLILFCFNANAQNEIGIKVAQLVSENTSFRHFSILTESNEIDKTETRSVVDKATFAKINSSIVNEIVINKYEYLELEIPYQSETVVIQLYKVNLFAEGFHIDTDKAKNVAYTPGVYYRGIVKGDTGSLVSFNFFEKIKIRGWSPQRGLKDWVMVWKAIAKSDTKPVCRRVRRSRSRD